MKTAAGMRIRVRIRQILQSEAVQVVWRKPACCMDARPASQRVAGFTDRRHRWFGLSVISRVLNQAVCFDAGKAVDEKGVLLMPAEIFDMEGQYFRMGYGRRNVPESLAVFEEFLRKG